MALKIDELLADLRIQFSGEASESLSQMENILLRIEKTATADDISEFKRLLHNFKGSARAVGFQKAAQIAHDIETECSKPDFVKRISVFLNRIDALNVGIQNFIHNQDMSLLI